MASYPEANAAASADDVTTPTAPHQHQHHHEQQPHEHEHEQEQQQQQHHHQQHEQFKPLPTPPSHDHHSHDPSHDHNQHHDHNHPLIAATAPATTAPHPELYDDSGLASSVPVPVTVTAVAHHGLQVLQAASAAPMSPTSNDLAQQYAQSAALQMAEPQFSSSLANPSLAGPLMGTHASQKVTRLRRACDMCSQRKVKVR